MKETQKQKQNATKKKRNRSPQCEPRELRLDTIKQTANAATCEFCRVIVVVDCVESVSFSSCICKTCIFVYFIYIYKIIYLYIVQLHEEKI